MDQETVGKQLVEYYTKAAEVASKVTVVANNLKVAIKFGLPMPPVLFNHTFGATMSILEQRGAKVLNREAFSNRLEGFEFMLALVDTTNPEYAVAMEIATGKGVAVAVYKRPEPSKEDYGLPAGAEDLTDMAKGA